MHPNSVNDKFFIIKDPSNNYDAIWIHILWDEDTEELIVWESTLIPPLRIRVHAMVNYTISQSANTYELKQNLDLLASEILSFDKIENQFISKEYIDDNGYADIKKYMIDFHKSWQIEDFLPPLKSGIYYWGIRSNVETIYDFFSRSKNLSQFDEINLDEYTAKYLFLDHQYEYREISHEAKSKYLKFETEEGFYFFHLKYSLEGVFYLEKDN